MIVREREDKMKSRTRKLAWLLSATMVLTTVNPEMMVMASEEPEAVEQTVDETVDSETEEMTLEEDESEDVITEEEELLTEETSEDGGAYETEAILDAEEYAAEENAEIAVQDADEQEATISRVTVIPKKTAGYAGLDMGVLDGSPVKMTYKNGTTMDGYISGSSVYRNDNNEMLSNLKIKYVKTDDEKEYLSINEAGEYKIEFWSGEERVSTADFIYKNRAVENLQKLSEEESNTVRSNDDPTELSTIWYEFIPKETGKYLFNNISYIGSIWKKEEDGTIRWIQSGQNAFKAEAGATYYIKFSGSTWKDGSYVYEWNTQPSIITEIQSIEMASSRRTEFALGIENDFITGAKVTIHYKDKSTEDLVVKTDWNNQDSQGNSISFSMKKEGDDTFFYHGPDSITIGSYGYDIYVDNEKVGDTGFIYKVVAAAQASYPKLTTGKNEVTTGESYKNWYRFTPSRSGRYLIDSNSSYGYTDIKDESGKEIDMNAYVVELTADENYYFGFLGRWQESEKIGVNISLLKEVSSVSNLILPKTELYVGMDTSCFFGTKATIRFNDGSTQQICFEPEYGENEIYLPDSRQTIKIYLRKDEKEYTSMEGLSAGDYDIGIAIVLDDETTGNKLQLDKQYKITLKNASEANFPVIKVGENRIQSSELYGQPNWYRFVAPETAKYAVSEYNALYVVKQTANGVEKVNIAYGRFSTEKDAVYYIGFAGEESDGDAYSWVTNIIKVNEIKKITGIHLARNTFVANADWMFTEGTAIDVTYQDNTTATLRFSDDSYVTDEYGTRISASLIKVNDPEGDYDIIDRQKAGEYQIVFLEEGTGSKIPLSQAVKTDAYTITIKEIEELDTGELSLGNNTITSSGCSYYANWYRFTPDTSGRYYFTDSGRYQVCTRNDEGELDTVRSPYSASAFQVDAGKTYYIGFLETSSGTTSMELAQDVKEITVVPQKTEFYAGISQKHVMADVIVTYDNDEQKKLSLDRNVDDDEEDLYRYLDDCGNSYSLSIKPLLNDDDDDYEYGIYSKLTVGTYQVTIAWTQNNSVKTSYDINVVELPTPFNSSSLSVTELVIGNNYTVSLNADEPIRWFRYTPKTDCNVTFQSSGDEDTQVVLYDEAGEWMDDDDDGGEETNFSLSTKLTGGHTYYYMTRMFNLEETATFHASFTVEGQTHTHTYVEERKEATCTATGYTQQKCSTCGEVKPGSYAVLPAKGHNFGAYTETVKATALAAGTKTRTCSVCGYQESAEVGKLPASVALSASTLPLQVKQSIALSKLITAMTTGDRLVSCATSNKKIATVNNAGKVTGKKVGKATITMTFASGISKKVTIKVQKKKVATSKISNVPGSITLNVKKTYKLAPVITPITTKDKVTYKTANKKVATVSGKGVITAKKAGKTTITVKVGKKTKKVKVTVKK